MGDPISDLALKFFEQGGVYVLLGLYLLQTGMTVLVVRWLAGRVETCEEARFAELRECLDAVKSVDVTIQGFTAAAKANTDVSEQNRHTLTIMNDLLTKLLMTR